MRTTESLRWLRQDLMRQAVRAWGQRRGEWRVQGQVLRRLNGWRVTEDRWGNQFLVDLDSYIDSHVYLFGAYEAGQVELVREVAVQRNVRYVLDIGANIGAFTVPLAQLPSVERVFAFEPAPDNRTQLQANLLMNRLAHKVTVMPFGLSDAPREAQLFDPESHPTGPRNAGMKSVERTGSGKSVTIDLRRLDDIVDLRGESLLIKMDVEGHEAAVLRGAQQTLGQNQVWMLLETFADKRAEADALLHAAGLEPVNEARAEVDNFVWQTKA